MSTINLTITTDDMDALRVAHDTLDELRNWGWDEVTEKAYEAFDEQMESYPYDGTTEERRSWDETEAEMDRQAEARADVAKEILNNLLDQLHEALEAEETVSLPSPSTSVPGVIL